jgi:hypothetical protein
VLTIFVLLYAHRIAAAALYAGPRVPSFFTPYPSKAWTFGMPPDSTQTFDASLIAMGTGIGFVLSCFRFLLFHEPVIRRVDFVLMLMQLQNALWYSLRACKVLPFSAGVLASVRETVRNLRAKLHAVLRSIAVQHASCSVLRAVLFCVQFSQMMIFAMYLSISQPKHRAVFVVSCVAFTVFVIGLVDRGIEVGGCA